MLEYFREYSAYWMSLLHTIQYKMLLATKQSVMLMANKVIKWKCFISKRSNVNSHTNAAACDVMCATSH